jgi:hypothetical protein
MYVKEEKISWGLSKQINCSIYKNKEERSHMTVEG